MRFLLLIAAGFPLAAQTQTFTLGTSADPCTGGTAYTMPATNATMRYGDFTCTFPVPADGLYQVTMAIQEPCIGACNPPVTGPNQRAENIYLNDSQVLTGLDPYGAGSNNVMIPIARTALIYSVNSKIRVRVQTVLRAGVLSAVSIAPGLATGGAGPSRIYLTAGTPPTDTGSADAVIYLDSTDSQVKVLRKDGTIQAVSAMARSIGCFGSGTTCTGVELWTLTLPAGSHLSYNSVPATPEALALPACPVASGACWQTIR